MNDADTRFLEESFKRYYFERASLVETPEMPGEREFGYQKFNSGMVRHISLKGEGELRVMLMQNSPSDVYCSNARYTFPGMPMKDKDWLGAHLIFDVDAKDLALPCRPSHTVHVCSCAAVCGGGAKCAKCGSERQARSLPCKECIGASKAEVVKLSTILVEDLGVGKDDIRVYFSGNEGFHVHVHDQRFEQLDSRARSDLVDYVMFKAAIPETFGVSRHKPKRAGLFDLGEPGWRGRLAKHAFGSKTGRQKMLTEVISGGHAKFQDMLAAAEPKIGARIDPQVTTDIHRIFRLPGSINSKSGLTKAPCKDLKRFDPYRESVFLGDGKVEVVANCPIQFSLGGRKFGPYGGQVESVPEHAAAYMVCKGLATMPP